MHSGISVIAQCSHERRVNPTRTTMVIRSAKRGDASTEVREKLAFLAELSSLQHSDGPRVLWDPSFSSLSIAQALRSLPQAIRWYSVSLCAPITRRNAHLVRGGGPIMVSNHSKLLSIREFSSEAWATLVPHALEFLIRPPPPTDYQSLGKHFRPATASCTSV